jgi:hypothetical protein
MPSTDTMTILKGRFLECCDCYTICPCWVKERPDEDHCNALYVWTFDQESKIQGHKIGGTSIAAAAFYGNRGGLQAAIYVDEDLQDSEAKVLLLEAFSGQSLPSLQGLANLVGTVVDSGIAKITHKREPKGAKEEVWEVTVEVLQDDRYTTLAHAKGTSAFMEKGRDGNKQEREKPLALYDTALHDELGLQNNPVIVQAVERFEIAVSPLPGGPFVYAGRSGMAADFDYTP